MSWYHDAVYAMRMATFYREEAQNKARKELPQQEVLDKTKLVTPKPLLPTKQGYVSTTTLVVDNTCIN